MVGQLAPLLLRDGSRPEWGPPRRPRPAFGIVGLAGTVLLGSMGLVQKVLLLGCLPLGAWGLSRFMRPLVSPRARVVAAICYLGSRCPTVPWERGAGTAWWPTPPSRSSWPAWPAPPPSPPSIRWSGHGWRAGRFGQTAALGAIIAAATSFAPAVLPMTLVCAVAFALGSLWTGQAEQAGRLAG